jgi:hypothetical protein
MRTLLLAAALALLTTPTTSFASGTVQINGYIFLCQHTCVVSTGPTGLFVSDSQGGWVVMHRKGVAVPVH